MFVSLMEHHSNLLPWKEAGAEVITIGEWVLQNQSCRNPGMLEISIPARDHFVLITKLVLIILLELEISSFQGFCKTAQSSNGVLFPLVDNL